MGNSASDFEDGDRDFDEWEDNVYAIRRKDKAKELHGDIKTNLAFEKALREKKKKFKQKYGGIIKDQIHDYLKSKETKITDLQDNIIEKLSSYLKLDENFQAAKSLDIVEKVMSKSNYDAQVYAKLSALNELLNTDVLRLNSIDQFDTSNNTEIIYHNNTYKFLQHPYTDPLGMTDFRFIRSEKIKDILDGKYDDFDYEHCQHEKITVLETYRQYYLFHINEDSNIRKVFDKVTFKPWYDYSANHHPIVVEYDFYRKTYKRAYKDLDRMPKIDEVVTGYISSAFYPRGRIDKTSAKNRVHQIDYEEDHKWLIERYNTLYRLYSVHEFIEGYLEKTCMICLDELPLGNIDGVCTLHCGHKYHKQCLTSFVAHARRVLRARACPYCGVKLTQEDFTIMNTLDVEDTYNPLKYTEYTSSEVREAFRVINSKESGLPNGFMPMDPDYINKAEKIVKSYRKWVNEVKANNET